MTTTYQITIGVGSEIYAVTDDGGVAMQPVSPFVTEDASEALAMHRSFDRDTLRDLGFRVPTVNVALEKIVDDDLTIVAFREFDCAD